MNKLKQFAKLIFMFIFQNDKLGKMYVEWGILAAQRNGFDDGGYISTDTEKSEAYIFTEEDFNPYKSLRNNNLIKNAFINGANEFYQDLQRNLIGEFDKLSSTQDIENMLTDLSYRELT